MNFKIHSQSEHTFPHTAPRQTLLRRDSQLLAWYQTVLLSAALGAIYLNLPIYLYVLNASFLPKYIFFGVFFLVTPLILWHYRIFAAYLKSPFVLWSAIFLVLNFIHLANFSADDQLAGAYVADGLDEARRSLITTRAQYVLFTIFLGFAVYLSPRKHYLHALVISMVLLPCLVIFDFANPGILYPMETEGMVLGRAAATFINPTMAGEAILHVFLLGCAVTAVKYRAPLFLLSGAAVLATFSRSSIIAWVLLLFILVARKTLPKSAIWMAAIISGICLLFIGSFENYLHSRQELEYASNNLLSRLNFFSSLKFDDDSSEERADVILAGWEMFLQNPVFGAGAGATRFWSLRGSTHNQLLLMAAEYGVFGVGLWFWLLVILWRGNFFEDRGLQIAMVFLFVFMSLFTHLMLDSATYWLATFALISIRYRRNVIPWVGLPQKHD